MIHLEHLSFSYATHSFALKIPLLDIGTKDHVVVAGESGSGKSTLLHLIAGILLPQKGIVNVNGLALNTYSHAERQDFRLVKMGLVFQEFELLEYLNLWDNILLPYRMSALLTPSEKVERKAAELLEKVGLYAKRHRNPAEISQGERQRVAVCRALVTSPEVILCDEPTGNLDMKNRDIVIKTILEAANDLNATLVVVSHDLGIASSFDRVIQLNDFVET